MALWLYHGGPIVKSALGRVRISFLDKLIIGLISEVIQVETREDENSGRGNSLCKDTAWGTSSCKVNKVGWGQTVTYLYALLESTFKYEGNFVVLVRDSALCSPCHDGSSSLGPCDLFWALDVGGRPLRASPTIF